MEYKIYKNVPCDLYSKAHDIIESGSTDDKAELALSVGMFHDNSNEAQKVCLSLMKSEDPYVRSTAARGLAYIAISGGTLDKDIVKPSLLKELRENTEFRHQIINSIEDINHYLGWKMGKRAIRSYLKKASL